jgi:hypothetical protein
MSKRLHWVCQIQTELVANKPKYIGRMDEYRSRYKRTERLLKRWGFYDQFKIV